MSTVICVDGLGGHPEVTFGYLKKVLNKGGHTVVLPSTFHVHSHEDRVHLALRAFDMCDDTSIFLLGQSAGGSAVRIAAERLSKVGRHLSGVIQLSPAMPFGILFMTPTLLRAIGKRWHELLRGEKIIPTREEYAALVSPLQREIQDRIVSWRQPISGKEARTLALAPPRFDGYTFPTLHIFGDQDKWIAPSAQFKLSKKLGKRSKVSVHEIKGAGHLTLASEKKEGVARIIQEWIKAT